MTGATFPGTGSPDLSNIPHRRCGKHSSVLLECSTYVALRSIGATLIPFANRPTYKGCVMKFLVLALALSSTVPSFCQTTPQHSIDPNQIFQMPKQYQLTPRQFSKPPSFQASMQIMPLPRVVRPLEFGDPQFDAEIIHRPPQESFGLQQPHTAIASDLYPNLKVLPVDKARLDAAPTD
jgi:hypothetical protein